MTSAYDPDPPSRVPLVGLAALAAFLLTAAAVGAFTPDVVDLLPRSHEDLSVQAVVERAITADQTVGLAAGREPGVIAGAMAELIRGEVRQRAAGLFVSPYREDWIARMDEAVLVGIGGVVFDGGAYGFHRWKIDIEGDRAAVSVRCRIYLVMAQTIDSPRSRADNEVDNDLTLVRIEGTWFVDSATQQFTPGGGP